VDGDGRAGMSAHPGRRSRHLTFLVLFQRPLYRTLHRCRPQTRPCRRLLLQIISYPAPVVWLELLLNRSMQILPQQKLRHYTLPFMGNRHHQGAKRSHLPLRPLILEKYRGQEVSVKLAPRVLLWHRQ
jgi:hypothetical protein